MKKDQHLARVIDVTDPQVLTHRLRQLGYAVAVFSPKEMQTADGDWLDPRDVEEAMVVAGNERLEFLGAVNDLDDIEMI